MLNETIKWILFLNLIIMSINNNSLIFFNKKKQIKIKIFKIFFNNKIMFNHINWFQIISKKLVKINLILILIFYNNNEIKMFLIMAKIVRISNKMLII